MTRKLLTATLLATTFALSAPAFAASIEGNWRTQSGETANIAKCGSSFCITLKSGTYSGKRIGKMKGSGNSYSGTITDPADDKAYSGSAQISGASMKLKGCALKIFCKTQNWKKM